MKTFGKVMCFALLFVAVIMLVGCAGNKIDAPQSITDMSQLSGCEIGIQTGSTFDAMTDEYIDDAQKKYYESFADMAVAVTQGKISAFLVDEPIARILCGEQKGIRYLNDYISSESYAFAFPKTENGGTLRDSLNEFLSGIRADGTLNEIEDKWFGTDESVKTVSYPGSTGASGTLRFITNSGSAPFSYVKDEKIVGYDIDIL